MFAQLVDLGAMATFCLKLRFYFWSVGYIIDGVVCTIVAVIVREVADGPQNYCRPQADF